MTSNSPERHERDHPPALLPRLRSETAAAHARLEAALPLGDASLTREAYVALLVRFRRLYAGAEAAVEPWAPTLAGVGVALAERRKTPLIDHDLATLGTTIGPTLGGLPPSGGDAPAFPVPTAGHAFGVLYVLEGSTLGGQVVLRGLERTLDITAARGGAFFASYGARVGPMWRQFCAGLEAYAARVPHESGAAVASAVAAFHTFERALLAPAAVPHAAPHPPDRSA